MVKQKKLSAKSALTIPKDLRLSAGFHGGIAVDLVETDEGILIRKHIPVCRYCGSAENVHEIKGDEVCAKCAAEIAQEVSKYA